MLVYQTFLTQGMLLSGSSATKYVVQVNGWEKNKMALNLPTFVVNYDCIIR